MLSGCLSLTGYYMTLFFYFPRGNGWLIELSALMRTETPLWFAFASCGAAAGLAMYLLVDGALRGPVGEGAFDSRAMSWRRGIERAGALSVGFGLNVLLFRIAPVQPLTTYGWDRAAPALLEGYEPGGDPAWWGQSHQLEWFCGFGALASLVVLLQGWSALRHDPHSRRQFAGLAVAVYLFGAGVYGAGALRLLPESVRRDLDRLGYREMLLEGRVDGRAGEFTDRHIASFSSDGTPLPVDGYWQEWVLGAYADDQVAQAIGVCDAVVLPRASYWAPEGVSIQLSRDATDQPAERVLTVPRYAARWYLASPERPGRALPRAGSGLEQELQEISRVILKADVMVPYSELLEILGSLREAGVDRVDLATVPLGFEPGPTRSLRWVEHPNVPTFRPGDSRFGRTVTIRKYGPPPAAFATVPTPWCRSAGDEERWLAHQWKRVEPNSLKPVLRIPEPQNHGELIALLERIRAGGSEAVVLPDAPSAAR